MSITEIALIVLAAAASVLVLFQLIAMLLFLAAVRKGMRATQEYASELRTSVLPVLEDSKELLHSVKQFIVCVEPRLEAAATDIAEITRTTRAQVTKIQASAEEINERVRRQAARIDGMTTSTLNSVDHVGQIVGQAVNVPLRRISGLIAAARAVVGALRTPPPPKSRTQATDHQPFVG